MDSQQQREGRTDYTRSMVDDPLLLAFPHASGAIAPLKKAAEAVGVSDFSVQWMGQSVTLAKETGAYELTLSIAADALRVLKNMAIFVPSNDNGH